MGFFLKAVIGTFFAFLTLVGVHYFTAMRDAKAFELVSELYARDRELTTRLIEKASLKCLPELKNLVSAKARHVIPDIVILAMRTKKAVGNSSPDDEKKQALTKILDPPWNTAPEKDLKILSKILKEANYVGSRSVTCIVRTSTALAKEHEAKKANSRAVLEGVKFRG